MALYTVGYEAYQGSPRLFKWGIAYNALATAAAQANLAPIQELAMGMSSAANTAPIQQGCQITSSLIDFTSAQPKLYRQLVAQFTALPSDSSITVQLDAWLDQDPAQLNATPDFTTNAVGSGVNGGTTGQTKLKLQVNKVATKLVYRVTTTGPSATTALTPAVKLQSVAIQVATGWAWHLFLAVAGSARCNDGATGCFESQPNGVDELSAYNFLRQLWRLKGGECKVTLPNGDSYNAILQLASMKSPKPFGSSYNAPSSYQSVAEVRFREDV